MINVVYASDNQFAEILGVSLTSLYEHNEAVVYVLDSGISDENKKKLESISIQYKQKELHWIAIKNISQKLGIEVSVDRGSLSQYARLFVASVLPAELERVLYLDCDVVIEENLEKLWNIDMQGNIIAALKEAFSKWYRMNIDLKPTDEMFNSGVMLIDLKKWQEKKIEEHLMNFISKKRGRIQQGDQGALNAVLCHNVYFFEPRYNAVTYFFDFSYDELLIYRKPPKGYYSKKEIEKSVINPAIIHFTTSFLSRRPWVEGCHHKYVRKWGRYKEMSPWRDSDKWKYERAKGLKGAYIEIIDMLPRGAVIWFSGVLQAFVRPWINRIWTK